MPAEVIWKVASASGCVGESMTLQIRWSPRPFLSSRRVVDACASTWPPTGFLGSDTKLKKEIIRGSPKRAILKSAKYAQNYINNLSINNNIINIGIPNNSNNASFSPNNPGPNSNSKNQINFKSKISTSVINKK